MNSVDPVSIRTMPRLLKALGQTFGAGVAVQVGAPKSVPSPKGRAGALVVTVSVGGKRHRFLAELRAGSTPRLVEEARMRAQESAQVAGLLPMVIVPHLSPARIDSLLASGVSGMDLSGNGLIIVPGTLLLRRDGQPNRFPDSRPSRFAYRRATSIVPRAFLCRAEYESVGAIREEIARRGSDVALSTVSKALARMVDDLLVSRDGDSIRLVQPDGLLDALAGSFRYPREIASVRLRWREPISAMFGALKEESVSLSGLSSVAQYSAGMRSDRPVIYCADLSRAQAAIGRAWSPEDRFPDITMVEIDDPAVLFATTVTPDGVVAASAVQTYLELNVSGDPRDREMALQVRDAILRDVRQ